MTLPADFPRPSRHAFERQLGAPYECAVCSMPADTHPTFLTELPEPATDGPQLPEDGIDYMGTPCPVCDVKSGSCVSRSGHYRPAHSRRLDIARGVA